MAYFTPDWVPIAVLLGLIGLSVGVSLLEAWPFAILIDTVLSNPSRPDPLNEAVLDLLPASRTGQIGGLVLLGLLLQLAGHASWLRPLVVHGPRGNHWTGA